MKIFKELKKLGYIHYSATTIEELDDLPLNSAERVSEQALVLRWFRENHDLYINVTRYNDEGEDKFLYYIDSGDVEEEFSTYEEAELACLNKLIEIVKQQTHATTN
jgi:hypothetical protein